MQAYPIVVHESTPHTGTPRLFTAVIHFGHSPLAPSVNSIREVEYRPMFRHESTAIRMTALRMSATPGMFSACRTSRNGDSPVGIESHGMMVTMSSEEVTKKNSTR